jgi:hypothetical protein
MWAIFVGLTIVVKLGRKTVVLRILKGKHYEAFYSTVVCHLFGTGS